MGTRTWILVLSILSQLGLSLAPARVLAASPEQGTVKSEHDTIGAAEDASASTKHTQHPDAQWYGDADFGLFIHWGICSVRSMNISWPMIPGRVLGKQKLDDNELARVVRECDWNLNGKPNEITPNEYWSMAKEFNPQDYHPDHWLAAAKAAGFTYAVLTCRHHEGFSMWPSKFDPDFNTSTWMGGRDLVKEYVEACRKNGIKVGLYYSPPDWHFDRDYMSFVYGGAYKMNLGLPKVGPDLKPRTTMHTKDEIEKHQAEYAALVKGQIEELLTKYGKIDLIWFDGKPAVPNATNIISQERIRQLQPGIVINPRLHGHGDYNTYERNLPKSKPGPGWHEFCDPWTGIWSHTDKPFRSNGFVLGELARSRAWDINFLLDVGPMASGELCEDAYKNMAVVAEWMRTNGESIKGAKSLPDGETASVPATSKGSTRYLFAIPEYEGGLLGANQQPAKDETLTFKGIPKAANVKLLGDGQALDHSLADGTLTVQLPASRRTKLVDVVAVELQ
ncbi:MAG TPA: alpha-L-fucosidase [Tepidisphaeraceae bacterium]|nr:alpha-L-fucosidase [Tepidisphaeraceae bacterium]